MHTELAVSPPPPPHTHTHTHARRKGSRQFLHGKLKMAKSFVSFMMTTRSTSLAAQKTLPLSVVLK
jgi:hypothetical protein